VVINILCNINADVHVVHVKMKTCPLTSDERVLIHALRVKEDGKRLEWRKNFLWDNRNAVLWTI